jgi:biotin carboxyl carrier protein
MKVRVQVDGELYDVEIGDLNSRPIQAIVDGELFAVWPEEIAGVTATAAPGREEAAAETLPPRRPIAASPDAQGADIVTAPLPGDIVVVAVRPGESVEAGQLLCTVESMKMNNPVRSTRAGVVAEVFVAVGDHVNFGQPMVRLR